MLIDTASDKEFQDYLDREEQRLYVEMAAILQTDITRR